MHNYIKSYFWFVHLLTVGVSSLLISLLPLSLLSLCLSVCLFLSLSLSFCLSVCLFVCLSLSLSLSLSTFLPSSPLTPPLSSLSVSSGCLCYLMQCLLTLPRFIQQQYRPLIAEPLLIVEQLLMDLKVGTMATVTHPPMCMYTTN